MLTTDEKERDAFHCQMVYIARYSQAMECHYFDATANRRVYGETARQQIPRFLEVYVDSPLETCVARDPKGIYRLAQNGAAGTVPGIQAEYQPPEHAELIVHGDRQSPETGAERLIAKLIAGGYLESNVDAHL